MQTNYIPELDIDSILRFEYAGKPVLTSVQVAAFFATTPNNIQTNFAYHRDEFTEGVDYFILSGAELVKFKETCEDKFLIRSIAENFTRPKDFQWISPKTRILYLWAKTAVARFAEIVTTPQAKLTFAALEQGYFDSPDTPFFNPRVTQPVVKSVPSPEPYELPNIGISVRERVEILLECLKYADSKKLRDKLITDIAYLIMRKIY